MSDRGMFGIDHDGDGIVSDLDDATTMAILEEERRYQEENNSQSFQCSYQRPVDSVEEKFINITCVIGLIVGIVFVFWACAA